MEYQKLVSPLLRHWPGRIIPLFLFLAFFLLYWHTLAPGLLPADNGELQLVAVKLGIAHPPGFPLYTLLAHLMSRLPLPLDPASKINLFSALSSALTVVVVYQVSYYLTGRVPAGLLAAFALGFSTTFWAQATTANIRSLTALFAALAIWLLLTRKPLWSWLAFILALGVGHHASLFFMGLVFGLYGLWLEPRFWREGFRPVLAALTGLLPLLYLPLRAKADAPGTNPALATWAGFWDHLLARGFRGDFFYFDTPFWLWERLKVMGNVLTFQFQPLLLAGMGVGVLLLIWRREGRLLLLLVGSFIVHLLVTATYRAPQTVEYMLPAYVPAGICLAYALTWGQNGANKWLKAGQWLLTGFLLMAALWQGVRNYPSYALLHRDNTASYYAQTVLVSAPAGAIILADWHWVTPLWYWQQVKNIRPDITVHYVFPTAEPYEQTWSRRIGEAYATGREVIATHFNSDAYASLPIPEPLGQAFWFRQQPRQSLPAGYTPLTLTLGQTIQILGYQLEPTTLEIGREAVLGLAWQLSRPEPTPFTLFAHLVGPDGRLYAQEDWPAQPQPAGISLSQFRLTPRPGSPTGQLSLAIGAYLSDATPLLDSQGQSRIPIATLTLTTMALPPFSQQPTFRPGPNRTLVGYDWDNSLPGQTRLYLHWHTRPGYFTEIVDLPADQTSWTITDLNWTIQLDRPQFYLPLGEGIIWLGSSPIPDGLTAGQPLTLVQHFGASRPVSGDWVVSGRIIGYAADNFHWAWWDLNDGVPALGAIPTLKWIAASQVSDPHYFTIPSQFTPGQTVVGLIRLYDAFTGRSLPILDERISQNYLGIPINP